MGQMVLYYAYC